MENIIVRDLDNGYKLLKAKEGYKLYNEATQKYYSEAVVKDIKGYVAVSLLSN